MSESIEIKAVKLKLGATEVELTVEQARKLKAALDELLGKEVKEVFVDRWHWWWQSLPVYYTVPIKPVNPDIWYTTAGGASYQVSNTSGTLSIQA